MNISKLIISTQSLYILTLIVLSFLLVRSSGDKCFLLDTPGWTYPTGDILLREGDNLTAYCLLDPDEAAAKNYSSEQIYFVFKDERIPQENVTILNSTAVVLNLYNLSLMNHWLHCNLDVPDLTPAKSSIELGATPFTKVCSNIVAVGTKPRDMENLSCYSYDWSELRCSWVEPYNEVRTTYRIGYQIPKRSGRQQTYGCPTLEDTGTFEVNGKEYRRKLCRWRNYRNNFEYLTMVLEGSNFIANRTQTIEFHNYAHIIPAAPRNFEVVDKTETSVYLKWHIGTLYTFDKGWFYRVNYTWNSSAEWNVEELNPKDEALTKQHPDLIFTNVTGLNPNTAYDFRVTMRSAVAPQNEGWSEPSSLIIKTKSCPPYRPPKTDRSSFEISLTESTDDYRIVFVYWQPVLRFEQNGDHFTYDIKVWSNGASDSEAELLALQDSYAKYRIKFDNYTFTIRSKNVEGLSNTSSAVAVPSRDRILKTPTIVSKVDYGEGVYELSWKPIESPKNANYTAFWCETGRQHPYQCDGFIDWIHLGNETKFNFTKNNYALKRLPVGLQFAVSAVTADSSSGMTWASCTVLHDTVNKIMSVWIDKIESYYIYIRWKLECSNRVDGIKGYYIYYCPEETVVDNKCRKDKEKTVTVYGDLDTDQANITELEPYKSYHIQIAMFTKNITGPRSEPLVERTLDGPPDVTDLGFESTDATNTSITLQWKPINKTNGVLRRFLITYNANTTEVPADATSVVLSNLTSYRQYEIKLQACTILCSPPVGPLKVTTRIGKPGKVEGLSMLSMNSTHVLVEWNKLSPAGGPRPFFNVRYEYNDSSRSYTERDAFGNYTVVEKHMCSSEQLLIHVRGVNKDEKTNKVYEGEWSKELRLFCPDEMKTSPLMKFSVLGTLFVLISGALLFLGHRGYHRYKEMIDVTITLPGALSAPHKNDLNNCNIYEDYNLRITKTRDEIRNLVDKTTELSLFSSQPQNCDDDHQDFQNCESFQNCGDFQNCDDEKKEFEGSPKISRDD